MPGSCERRHTVLVPCCSSTPPGLLMWTCLLLLLCYMEMWWGNKDSYLTKIIKSPGLSDLLLDTMHLILATRFICGFLHLVRNNLNRVTLNRRAFLCVSCVLTQSMRQWHHHVATILYESNGSIYGCHSSCLWCHSCCTTPIRTSKFGDAWCQRYQKSRKKHRLLSSSGSLNNLDKVYLLSIGLSLFLEWRIRVGTDETSAITRWLVNSSSQETKKRRMTVRRITYRKILKNSSLGFNFTFWALPWSLVQINRRISEEKHESINHISGFTPKSLVTPTLFSPILAQTKS